MRFRAYFQARRGARSTNQDRVGVFHTDGAVLLVVCDGMGGHYRGDIASQFVLDHIARAFRTQASPRVRDPAGFLARSIEAAHLGLWAHTRDRGLPGAPRTTVVAALVQDGRACWAHVGDSRLYLVRDGAIAHRTRDHSHVQALFERGSITAAQAAVHPDRNKIYNCVGQGQPPLIDVRPQIALRADDVLLLSSDGFWGAVPDSLLLAALASSEIDAALPTLMNAAEVSAGPACDNVSVAALRALHGPAGRMMPVLATPIESRIVSDAEIDTALTMLAWGAQASLDHALRAERRAERAALSAAIAPPADPAG